MRNAEGFLCVFFCTDFAGDTNCRRRVRPDGAALFLHRLSGVRELRQRVRPFRAGSFSLNLSGELRSAERGDSPRPAAGQEGRHQGFYPLNSHFLLGESGADCRHVTAAKQGNGSRVTAAFVSQLIRSSQTAYCYTYGLINELCGITVPHNSSARYDGQGLRR